MSGCSLFNQGLLRAEFTRGGSQAKTQEEDHHPHLGPRSSQFTLCCKLILNTILVCCHLECSFPMEFQNN
jgi:hypothetical protein